MPYKSFLSFTLFTILLLKSVYAQTRYEIRGSIIDSASSAMSGANVALISGKDTLKTISDSKGIFLFTGIKQDMFLLKIRYLGFVEFNGSFSLNHNTNIILDPIRLKVDENQLKEVVVKANAQPVVLKKDTTEYNVSSFSANEKEMVEALLKRLPGVSIDKNGNVISAGKIVTKLKVNGKTFFTGNIQQFIKQLPVGILSKVQIIEDYGDAAAFTNIKKGQTSKILNLVTKPGLNNGVFGNINVSAGSNERLGINLSDNYWNGDKQISSTADLNTAKNITGSNVADKITLNYNNKLDKNFEINTLYTFYRSRSSTQNTTFSETINSIGIIDNSINSTFALKNSTHAFAVNLNSDPNKKTFIKAELNLSVNNSINNTIINSQQSGVIKQGLVTNNIGSEKTPQGSISLTAGKKFNKDGRLLMVSFKYLDNHLNNIQQIDRNIHYYDTLGNLKKDSVSNNLIRNTNNSFTTKLNLTYSEPITSKSNLDITYDFTQNRQKNAFVTNLNLKPDELVKIDSLSNSFKNVFTTHRFEVSYRYSDSKFNIIQGISYQRNILSGYYDDQLNNIQHAVNNIIPIVNLSYQPSTNNHLDFKYLGNSQAPTFDQLRPIQDIRNLQDIIVGNPELKPSFNHQVEINFNHYGTQSNQSLSLGLTGSIMKNQIINNTTLTKDTLNSVKQLTSYRNVNGSYSTGGNYNWSLPVNLFKLKIQTNILGSVNFNRNIVYTDNIQSYNYSKNFSQTVQAVAYGNNYSTDLAVNFEKSYNHYTVGQGLNSTVSRWTIILNGKVTFLKNSTLSIESNKSFNGGYINIKANNPLVVNATLTQLFLKGALSLGIQGLDIFNQNKPINQTVSGNTIINNRINYISRYFILNASFQISKFGIFKKSTKDK